MRPRAIRAGALRRLRTRTAAAARVARSTAAQPAPPLASGTRHGLLRHDAHLLRQRGAAPRPCVHDDRGGHPRPPPPPARRGRLLPHRHRRARGAGRQGGRGARASRRKELADRNAQRFLDLLPRINVVQRLLHPHLRPAPQGARPGGHAAGPRQRPHLQGPVRGLVLPASCADFKTEAEIAEGNTCPIHRIPLDREHEENWFFRLSAFEQPLKELYAERPDFVAPAVPLQRGARVHQRRPAGRLAQPREAHLGRRGPVGPGPRLLRLVRRAPELLHGALASPATART